METDFDWIAYLENYEDLRNAGINTEEKALEHWNNHGRNEGRIDKDIKYIRIYHIDLMDKTKVNSTRESGGRLGNVFIRNMVSSLIAKKK